MIQHLEGIVEAVTMERTGAQEILVRVEEDYASENAPDDAAQSSGAAPNSHGPDTLKITLTQTPVAPRNALNLTALTGRVAVGDRVLLNTVAVEMKLGTGGLDFVVARPGRQEAPDPS